MYKLHTIYILFGVVVVVVVDSSVIPITQFVNHNGPCNSTFPCDPQSLLTCTAGTCQCESPSNQRYCNVSQKCVSIVGGQCSLALDSESTSTDSSPFRNCIENAHCISIAGGNYTECQCIDDYIENSAGSCVPGIGKPCSYEPDECNPLGMVVCKNGKCECLDKLQVYDKEMKRCVSPAGTHCRYDGLQLGCVKNAICYPFYYWMLPKCTCKPGYFQTLNRTCVMEFAEVARDLTEI